MFYKNFIYKIKHLFLRSDYKVWLIYTLLKKILKKILINHPARSIKSGSNVYFPIIAAIFLEVCSTDSEFEIWMKQNPVEVILTKKLLFSP